MKKIYLICVVILFFKITNAETIIGGQYAGSTMGISCPGSTSNYGISGLGAFVYKWKITKGTVNGQTQVCGTAINVTWDTNLAADGKLELYRVANCNTAISGNPVATLNVRKFNYGPALITSATAGDCNSVPPTLTCSPQTINVTFWYKSNNTDYGTYPWTVINNANSVSVPAGWSVTSIVRSGSSISCGIFNGLNYSFETVTLTIHTDGQHFGDVKFRVKGGCDGNYPNFYGDWSSYNLSAPAPALSLVGNAPPLTFCNSSSSVASVSGTNISSYTWTVPQGYLINGTSTTLVTTSNSVTITSPTATANGILTVKGINCAGINSNQVNLTLYYGAQTPGPVVYSINRPPKRFRLIVGEVPGATSYNWYVNNTLKGTTTMPIIDLDIKGNLECYMGYYFGVKAVTACGISDQSFVLAPDPLQCGQRFAIFPNPASSVVNVTSNDTDQDNNIIQSETISNIVSKKFSIILYDNKGNVLRSATNENSKNIAISTQDIPDGTYYIHIKNDKQTIKKQLIINH